jgi:hypothetical protein
VTDRATEAYPTEVTVLLVDSPDVSGSIGRTGFLETHLRSHDAGGPGVGVITISGGRCDVLAQRLGGSPPELVVPAELEGWFSEATAPVEVPATAALLVLSMAGALTAEVWRHRRTGLLVEPPDDWAEAWSDAARAWLGGEFEIALADSDLMAESIRQIAARLEAFDAALVVFNTSTYVPGEEVFWYEPDGAETVAVCAVRLNLVIDRLVPDLGLTLLDVDRVTAELGAGDVVTAAAQYTSDALEVLGDEALAAIRDLPRIHQFFSSDAMRLAVPRYDRRTEKGVLTRWHVDAGAAVAKGDSLFDLRFDGIHAHLDATGENAGRSISLSVVAGREGFLDSISVPAGGAVEVGTGVGVMTAAAGIQWDDVTNAAAFPVGVRVETRDGH